MNAPTLLDTLRRRATDQEDEVAFSIGAPGTGKHRTLSFCELDQWARIVGDQLRASGVERGDRVVIMLPTSLEYVAAVFGALYAGAMAVPLLVPTSGKNRDRMTSVLLDARPKVALVAEDHLDAAVRHLQTLHLADRCRALPVTSGAVRDPGRPGEPSAIDPSDVALLQYTSGSTADPKGVMVTHANIVANSEAIGRGFGHRADRRPIGVCWLPLYHDMGIVGSVFHAVQVGGHCHLLDPAEFLFAPARWLQLISDLGAQVAGGPNFGFDWCVDHITDEQMAGVDLSGWTTAYNGSEPVRVETLERFADRFGRWGFDPAAFLPCYGLAEFTLFVSGAGLETSGMTQHVDRAELVEGRIRPVSVDSGRTMVASGRPDEETEVRIVDPEGVVLDDGEIGEILVSGPSRAAGYWRNRSATADRFDGINGCHEGFLRSGDLGYLRDGLLFVIGRRDEVIVVRGRNLHPHDLEAAARRALDSRRNSATVAVAGHYPTGTELVVLSEVSRSTPDLAAVARDIRLAVTEACGTPPRMVGLVPRRTIPKTSSGKLRRIETAARLRQGRIELLHTDELDVTSTTKAPRPPLAKPYRPPSDAVEVQVVTAWENALRVGPIGTDDRFLDLGGDSLSAANVATVLSSTFQIEIDLGQLFDVETPADVAALIRSKLNDDEGGLVEIAL